MLNPRNAPKIYRQNDTWHVRIYVPKPVVRLVGAKELHRSTSETNRPAALRAAEKIRAELYVWFNELLERETRTFATSPNWLTLKLLTWRTRSTTIIGKRW